MVKFSNLKLKDKETYVLRHVNINLFQNGKYIINRKKSTTSQGSGHTLLNMYKEFCQIQSLEQLTTCPTRVTCNMLSFIDHILTNSTEKFFQSGIIGSGVSDHQLFFLQEK